MRTPSMRPAPLSPCGEGAVDVLLVRFRRQGRVHRESLERLAADGERIDWWECAAGSSSSPLARRSPMRVTARSWKGEGMSPYCGQRRSLPDSGGLDPAGRYTLRLRRRWRRARRPGSRRCRCRRRRRAPAGRSGYRLPPRAPRRGSGSRLMPRPVAANRGTACSPESLAESASRSLTACGTRDEYVSRG